MVKNFLLAVIAVVASATTLFAQPTLTAATNDPVPGDQFYGYFVDTNFLSPGAAGASVTWNYPSMVRNDTDTVRYFTCATTTLCDSFPGTQIVMYSDNSYAFGTQNASGMKVHGFYSEGNYVHLTNPHEVSHYPLTYGTTYNDTFALTFNFMGFDITVTTRSVNTADAWGTLTLPTGTYNNVLRVHSVITTSQSVAGFPSEESQTETYNWYMSGFHSPLLTMDMDTVGATSPYLSSAKYYAQAATVSVKNTVKQMGTMDIFPNPAADNARVRFHAQNAGAATAIVMDMAGKAVYTTQLELKAGTNEMTLPVNNLPNGIYMVRVQGADITANGRFSVMK